MHRHLQAITAEQHAGYQTNIANFLRSEQGRCFSAEEFVAIIAANLVQDLRMR